MSEVTVQDKINLSQDLKWRIIGLLKSREMTHQDYTDTLNLLINGLKNELDSK